MKFSLLAFLLLASSSTAQNGGTKTYTGSVTITNMAPANGTCFTPVWLGFQDGAFDMFNVSEAVLSELESIVEDGDFSAFKEQFINSRASLYDLVAGGETICSGQTVEQTIDKLTVPIGVAFYLSYVAMILPSNDAFIGNDDPFTYKIFDTDGSFIPTEVNVIGTDVLDAGTEVNDELRENIPTLDQAAPNTGTAENSTVTSHAGFNAVGSGGILDIPFLDAADFTAANYHIMKLIVNMTELVEGYGDSDSEPTTTDVGDSNTTEPEAPADSPPASAPTSSTGSPPTGPAAASGTTAFVASSWIMVVMMAVAAML